MTTKQLSLVAIAAAFAVSSSAAMLQSSRPALADADDHHPRQVVRHNDRDRDDRNRHAGYHRFNGQWVPNNVANNNGHWVNGQWVSNANGNWNANPGKHKGWKHKKHHHGDRD
ncbi:MAG TPA: hypothetical protein VGC72_04770 [Candidatus Elarobacter sp.]|jgi:Ni/Co efflux regulator RcnB